MSRADFEITEQTWSSKKEGRGERGSIAVTHTSIGGVRVGLGGAMWCSKSVRPLGA